VVEVIWVGLDVHKERISVAAAQGWAEPRLVATVANDGHQLPKLLRRLTEQGELRCAYEAGPCGYEIYRMCERLHINCVVIAPSLVPKKAGERVKTDRRDALKLCRCLRSQDLTAIWVPDPEHEALRDLVRAREVAVEERMRARHRIKKMLLRQGVRPPQKMRVWGQRYRHWLGEVEFAYPAQQLVWREYLAVLDESVARIARYNQALAEQAAESPKAYLIAALQILKGVSLTNAVTLVAELGDITRFRRPPQLFDYAGMVSSEYSSGDQRRQGRDHQDRQSTRAESHYRGRLGLPLPTRIQRSPRPAEAGRSAMAGRHLLASPGPLAPSLPGHGQGAQAHPGRCYSRGSGAFGLRLGDRPGG